MVMTKENQRTDTAERTLKNTHWNSVLSSFQYTLS